MKKKIDSLDIRINLREIKIGHMFWIRLTAFWAPSTKSYVNISVSFTRSACEIYALYKKANEKNALIVYIIS